MVEYEQSYLLNLNLQYSYSLGMEFFYFQRLDFYVPIDIIIKKSNLRMELQYQVQSFFIVDLIDSMFNLPF